MQSIIVGMPILGGVGSLTIAIAVPVVPVASVTVKV